MKGFSENSVDLNGRIAFYLDGGPQDGPLLIFVHGWPDIAEMWKPQLTPFAELGFRVVAPDTHGYGRSSKSRDVRAYSLERLVADCLALLAHLDRKRAVWIGHDWGSGIVSALVAHHPEVCAGVVNVCVPYRTIELGLEELLPLVNREIYPEQEYPNGQWDYMAYYEQSTEKAIEFLNRNGEKMIKLLHSRVDPASFGEPSRTSTVIKDGGWFGGATDLPDIALDTSMVDEDLHAKLKDSLKDGWFPATAYYLNHDVNRPYGLNSVNDGVVEVPMFFIDAKYDGVCSTATAPLGEPMRKLCRNLTECRIEAGHWVGMEKPREVNAALAKWLVTALPDYWPGPQISLAAKI